MKELAFFCLLVATAVVAVAIILFEAWPITLGTECTEGNSDYLYFGKIDCGQTKP